MYYFSDISSAAKAKVLSWQAEACLLSLRLLPLALGALLHIPSSLGAQPSPPSPETEAKPTRGKEPSPAQTEGSYQT